MTIVQLKYFIALAETLNFTKVAEQFYVAQTGISYSIKSLENELNVKLFERSTKKVELTTAGQIFYARVKSAVQIIDIAQSNIISGNELDTLSIGCSRLCSGATFYRVAEHYQQTHPNLKLYLCADEPELTLLNRLDNGEIDLAVYLKAPYTQIPEETTTEEFCARIPRKIIVSRWHPFAGRSDGIPVEEIASQQIISYANLERTRQYLPSNMNDDIEQLSIQRAIVAADFHSMLDMIASNLGIACIPLVDDLNTESVCSRICIEPLTRSPSIAATYSIQATSLYVKEFITALFEDLKARFPEGFIKK